jgi:primosomal protein N'
MPVFDRKLAESLHWAAGHYVAPLSVLLAKASPPNLPRRSRPPKAPVPELTAHEGLFAEIAAEAGQGRKRPIMAVVSRWDDLDWVGHLARALEAGSSVVVITATVAETAGIEERAIRQYGDRLIALTSDDAAFTSRCWERAQSAGCLIVGTPKVATWQIAGLTLAVILEEGRRAMKERQTPTLHVRDVMSMRSRVEGFNTVYLGPTPSVELLAAGASMVKSPGRPWGLVEVVDRSGESPGGRFLTDHAISALRNLAASPGDTAFVLTGRALAPRVAEEINNRLGGPVSAVAPTQTPVVVGTERDLAGIRPVSLAVATSVEALHRGGGYRGPEEALRQLARLGALVRRGRGHRLLVQTDDPRSDLIDALRRGDPIPYLEKVLVDRAREGFPPASEMLAIEVRGRPPQGLESDISELGAKQILGPMTIPDGRRWLLSGDLARARVGLRSVIGAWREKGATVRIDADPIDM